MTQGIRIHVERDGLAGRFKQERIFKFVVGSHAFGYIHRRVVKHMKYWEYHFNSVLIHPRPFPSSKRGICV